MASKILIYSFYLLFAITPLIWFPWNFELFEYNKMMFVYFLAIIITASWILKMIQSKSLILKRTPLDIPLLLFLLANILSTIFSIDRHVSIWGYYSRSNGGLLSLISYLSLYYALVSNFDSKQVLRFLKAAVFGGVAVTLWAIPEHFGVSPSCVILTNQFNASCWVQDVQARVFATLGQPNWLAAYLAMLIFPTLYFLLTAKSMKPIILNTCYLILFYLAFTFTYSRGATLGLWAGLAVFLGFLTISTLRLHPGGVRLSWIKQPLILVIVSFFVINILFGSALTQFKLLSKFAAPERPSVAITKPAAISTTQLESGGTESGQIRLIVWRGAIDIFKAYPVFGSGVETFAYSYYTFRPIEHNLVSEWDFLYNKAHNEFLNYLATTGLIGFLTYMGIIITFIVFCIKGYVLGIKQSLRPDGLKGKSKDAHNTYYIILIPSLLASYISYLVQNFFGFSVVSVALFFFLFPTIAFITTDSIKPFILPKQLYALCSTLYAFLYRRPLYPKLATVALVVIFGLMGFSLTRNYIADIYFATGNQANESGNPGRAYNFLSSAVSLNPGEPYYRSELGYAAAASASVLIDQESTMSAQLKETAIQETNNVLSGHPKNVSFFRTAIRTFYMLSAIDKEYTEKTLEILDKTIALSPTDAKLTYNKAIILGQMGKNDEAIKELEQTVKLKTNYRDAHYTLGLFYFETGQKEKAVEEMNTVLKLIPNDPDALEKLKKRQ